MPPRKEPSKPVRALPKREIVWVHATAADGREFYETSSPDRTTYYLYQKRADGYLLLAKGRTPLAYRHLLEEEPVKKPRKKRS